MTEVSSELVTVHRVPSGQSLGELNRNVWEPVPLPPVPASPRRLQAHW